MPSRLAVADPVPVVRGWLATHPLVLEALGVTDAAPHITDTNEPPYPHIRLTDPPGVDGALRHLLAPRLSIEVHGDLDGTHPKSMLRAVLYAVLEALTELPDRTFGPGEPVVTAVTSSGGGGWVPEPNRQPRYIATVTVHIHPPTG